MPRVTLTDGPLKGHRYDIPDGAEVLDPHPGLPRGRYVVKGDSASWVPNKTSGKAAAELSSVPETTVTEG